MGNYHPAEDVMTTWPFAQTDLFLTAPCQTHLALPQRVEALTLLQALLTEAIGAPTAPSNAQETSEAGDDENHA
jgi:hypothetical protein